MTTTARSFERPAPTLRARLTALALGRGVVDRLPDVAAWIVSVPLLAARLWLADIFFKAGRVRIESWDSQTFLFTEIHPVPFVPASITAPLTTAAELALPVLLAVGLLGRLGAFGLMVMAMVIQFVVAQTPQGIENGIGNSAHYWWMLVGLVLTVTGAGRLSLDALLARRFV